MVWENTYADTNAAVNADTVSDADTDAIVDPDADTDANAVADEAADADDTMSNRVCCHEAIFSKTLAWVFFCCLFMYRNGTKILKKIGRRFHDWKLV